MSPPTKNPVEDDSGREDFNLKRDAVNNYNQFLVCGALFECPATYLPIKPIGKGAYGVVCSARNLETNERVAIKKIANAFENIVDAKRTLREIKLLRHMNHENIISIKDIIPPPSRGSFKDVYVVYELMDTDLHQIIRSPQPLSDDHCQYFLYQVLRGLKYIHSANILHRDLKPSNLLVNANCDLRICDFGLARTSNEKEFMTEYVVTRWYRAPELLLSCSEYTAAIDVWSVGCIFAELLGRKPLFPGKDYVHQLNLITRVLGSPSDSELDFIASDKAKRYIRSLPHCDPTRWEELFPHAAPVAIDLVSKMLVFDPSRRITVEQVLEHPYLASLHDLSDEPVCGRPFTFEFDAESMTPAVVRAHIIDDMLRLHPGQEAEWASELAVLRGGGGSGGAASSSGVAAAAAAAAAGTVPAGRRAGEQRAVPAGAPDAAGHQRGLMPPPGAPLSPAGASGPH